VKTSSTFCPFRFYTLSLSTLPLNPSNVSNFKGNWELRSLFIFLNLAKPRKAKKNPQFSPGKGPQKEFKSLIIAWKKALYCSVKGSQESSKKTTRGEQDPVLHQVRDLPLLPLLPVALPLRVEA
jgi:hypothetical protein